MDFFGLYSIRVLVVWSVTSFRFFMLTLRDQNQRPFHVPRKGGLPRETVHGGIERRFTVGDVE